MRTNDSELTRLTFDILTSEEGRRLSTLADLGVLNRHTIRRAINLAETLQHAVAERGAEPIHAYRLFPCDPQGGSDPMSQVDILQCFHDAGWEDGMQAGTLRKRIEDILNYIAEVSHQKKEGLQWFIERRDFGSPFYDDINGVIGELLTDFHLPDVIGNIDELRSEIARVVRRMIDRAMAPVLRESGTSESPTDPLTIAYFMRFVCGHDTVDEAMEARSAKQLMVRPYELFLFARQQDFMTTELTRLRKDFGKDFVPQPEYTGDLSIMVAHGGAEAALDYWEAEDNKRLREREERESTAMRASNIAAKKDSEEEDSQEERQ